MSFRDRKSNHQWSEEAEHAYSKGDYLKASELYENAKGATLGHGRRDGYQSMADRCKELANEEEAKANNK